MSGKERLASILSAKREAAATGSPIERAHAPSAPTDGGGAGGQLPEQTEAFSALHGDARVVLRGLEAESFDAIITDPGVGSGDWGASGVPDAEFWGACERVAKPGAHMVVFSGRKKDHRVKCAAEDAGWEIRDTLLWIYPKGMPMAIDAGQAVAKKKGEDPVPYFRTIGSMSDAERAAFYAGENPWYGWGTELRPSWEPIALFRKPFRGSLADNLIENGVGALNIDATRIPTEERDAISTYIPGGQGDAHGLALTKFQQVVGKTSLGRWPADVLFSHTEQCSSVCAPGCAVAELERLCAGAAKFFYCPKADRREKDLGLAPKENSLKGVKPVSLMTWLCDLVVPTGGRLLDPTMGSGSTALGAIRLDGSFVGVDVDPNMVSVATRRFEAWREKRT
jgi:site-specific DNA-methyltransferase (adenine-specific)